MTDPSIQRIETDRKRRESLLLLALLSVSRKALSQARGAIRQGINAVQAAVDAIRGVNRAPAHVHWQGLESRVQPVITEAYTAGIVRTGIMAGVTIEPESIIVPPSVAAIATDLASKTEVAVARVVTASVNDSNADGLNAAKTVIALGEAFDAAGLTAERSDALEVGAELAVVKSYGGGLFHAAEHKDLIGRVLGFKYVSVLDESTTTICRAYNGVTLPTSHPWFLTHFPACHFRCRAIIRPVFKPFVPTENPPTTPPPLPGFGIAPLAAFGAVVGR